MMKSNMVDGKGKRKALLLPQEVGLHAIAGMGKQQSSAGHIDYIVLSAGRICFKSVNFALKIRNFKS